MLDRSVIGMNFLLTSAWMISMQQLLLERYHQRVPNLAFNSTRTFLTIVNPRKCNLKFDRHLYRSKCISALVTYSPITIENNAVVFLLAAVHSD